VLDGVGWQWFPGELSVNSSVVISIRLVLYRPQTSPLTNVAKEVVRTSTALTLCLLVMCWQKKTIKQLCIITMSRNSEQ